MKWLVLIFILIPSISLGYTSPDKFPGWKTKTPQQKMESAEQATWREEERFDKYVIACLQVFDNTGRDYNDEWHEKELPAKAVRCANFLMYAADQSLHPKEEAK